MFVGNPLFCRKSCIVLNFVTTDGLIVFVSWYSAVVIKFSTGRTWHEWLICQIHEKEMSVIKDTLWTNKP